jgi:glycosyltransferase involved in cell wall biosynthesis
MSTLIISPFTPHNGTGRGLRTVGVARALARAGEVEIAYVRFDGLEPSTALAAEPRVKLRALDASRGGRRAVLYSRARRRGTPRAYARGISPELVEAARSAGGYERVIADGPTAAAALLVGAAEQPFVYNAHNLESGFRFALETSQQDYGTQEALERFERNIITRGEEAWFPTSRDVESAARLAPEAILRYVPNVIDVNAIREVVPTGSCRIVFVADRSYQPNRDACGYLISEVMPILWRSIPEATLALVGRGPAGADVDDPRIETLGFVERLSDVYESADAAVVPLLEGGGSPLKLIEAMAYGLPVVATAAAVRGLDGAEAGQHFLLGDDPDGFAEAVAQVLRGEHGHLGRQARALVEDRYSIEALAEILGSPVRS